MGLCLAPYGGPRGVEVSYERGTLVSNIHFNSAFLVFESLLVARLYSSSSSSSLLSLQVLEGPCALS